MSANTLYFPICLLRNFEGNEQETAKKILKYCHDVISKKSNPKEATKALNCRIDFEQKYFLEPNSPITFINADFVKNMAEGCEIDYTEKCVFLFVCAVNSISKNVFFLTNWQMIANRASGYKSVDNKRLLSGISKRFTARSHKFKETLLQNVKEIYNLRLYSCIGLRGFYLYRNMSESDFLELTKDKIKKATKETFNTEYSRQTQNKLSIEKRKKVVQVYADNAGLNLNVGNDFLQIMEAKNILLTQQEKVLQELKLYYR